jgi:hypothetical protein
VAGKDKGAPLVRRLKQRLIDGPSGGVVQAVKGFIQQEQVRAGKKGAQEQGQTKLPLGHGRGLHVQKMPGAHGFRQGGRRLAPFPGRLAVCQGRVVPAGKEDLQAADFPAVPDIGALQTR